MNTTLTYARDNALHNLVSCVTAGNTADLPGAKAAAREQGITEEQIDQVCSRAAGLQPAEKTRELSLSEQLARATRSSCCS